MTQKNFKIGTRGSPLALIQADMVAQHLTRHEIPFEIVTVSTSGDRIQNRKLAEIGGKALFTKELEEALYTKEIDCAVHSMKDVETQLPPGLVIPCMLQREDPRDAFISRTGCSLQDLPEGAKLGTASPRRAAQVLNIRPDLKIVLFRGNVATRLAKIEEGQADATLLALAGLKRLEMEDVITEVFNTDTFIPAAGQGVVGVECRSDDSETIELLESFNHMATYHCVTTERALLKGLQGTCDTPVGAYAEEKNGIISLSTVVMSLDGQDFRKESITGPWPDIVEQAQQLGEEFHSWFSCQNL